MATIAFQPGPGAQVLALVCDSRDEYDALVEQAERGVLRFDGQPVESVTWDACNPATLFLRFRLAHPYLPPPLVLHFDDLDVAVAIGQSGWYSFEGGLYRAEHRGDGEVVLDRVFPAEPPAVYHGRAYAEPPVLEDDPDTTQSVR
jgi:hypothetical protein